MPVLLAVVLLLTAPSAAAAERWRWPLRGEVLTRFHLAASRFAPGQHRGIDIAAGAGAPVRSACAGRVRFAGEVPGRGRAVTVACGPLVATHLELGATSVARGATVAAGDRIGTVAASHLQLGVRRAGDPHGYVDPLTLLTDPPPPLGAAPRGRRRPRLPPAPAPAARPVPRPAERPALAPAGRPLPRPAARPASLPALPLQGVPAVRPADSAAPPAARPPALPLAAWLGLALVAAGTPLGVLRRRRRRRAPLAAARAVAA